MVGVTGAASPFRQFAAGFVGFKGNTKPMLAILTDWHYLYSLISTFSKSDDSDGSDGFFLYGVFIVIVVIAVIGVILF